MNNRCGEDVTELGPASTLGTGRHGKNIELLITAVSLLLWIATFRTSEAWTYRVKEVNNGGSIVGRVVFSGDVPSNSVVDVKKDRELCGNSIRLDRTQVGENGGLKNVIVSIEDITQGKAPREMTVVLENRQCLFVPRVLAVCKGSWLEVVNQDPVFHTVHPYLGNRTVFNLALVKAGKRVRKKLRSVGLMEVLCDQHSWMKSYIWVGEHPYYAVTDERGLFEITDIPPGDYRVRAWHEVMGARIEGVTISKGTSTTLNFQLQLEGKEDMPRGKD